MFVVISYLKRMLVDDDIEERANIVIKSFLERHEEQQKKIIEKEINERQTYTISSLLCIQEQQLRKKFTA